MNLEWILNPLTIYAVVAVALLACLALSLGTKLELVRVRRAADGSRRRDRPSADRAARRRPPARPSPRIARRSCARPSSAARS